MEKERRLVGIDVGSVAIGLVVMDGKGAVCSTAYRFHQGDIRLTLQELLKDHLVNTAPTLLAVTESSPSWIRADLRVNNQVAAITCGLNQYPTMRGLLLVGGEQFSLALFDETGGYQGSTTNTSCAAGTGAFLDQQAARLGLEGSAELGRIAAACTAKPPKIATRCAVFAKTDLIHAQQEGFGLDAISDGLCAGLARNVVETLFTNQVGAGEIIFCGGVSRNSAVASHIERLLARPLIRAEQGELYGALGACQALLAEQEDHTWQSRNDQDLLAPVTRQKNYYYEPLTLRLSSYPDFTGHQRYDCTARPGFPVEVERYLPLQHLQQAILGIDIGSTSTKAVLVDDKEQVLAGFYTRTAGRPLNAVQAILAAIADIEARDRMSFVIIGCATTGSGRKFIGTIIGADLVVDEITTHARAACMLHPEVDTIIEIGGQDAKFTTLKQGRVTQSIMNNVCAAGTGSFIEEQAARLGCPVDRYAERTEGVRAPMASDRCTVFMERDINHLLSQGYSVEEVLATVLHSVRENYLSKVALEKHIGKVILFQGATARNRSLVAAFEQRLDKPILVSRYCHLTGALGAALILAEDRQEVPTRFIGIGVHSQEVPLQHEICTLCANHCKITVATIGERTEAYGFLCGRDYATPNHVRRDTGAFDLNKARRGVFTRQSLPLRQKEITIGLPAAVHLVDDLSLWQRFFDELGIPTVTSKGYGQALEEGKKLTRAEFCAPITAMHGHAHHLLTRADYVFLPVYLEQKNREARRQYCYYTQFLPALTSQTAEPDQDSRFLRPVLRYLYTGFHTRMQLYRMLKGITRRPIGFLEVNQAYDRALAADQEQRKALQQLCQQRLAQGDRVRVVLLGRPYTIFDPAMNGSIPRIFNDLGIDTFSQDMLEPQPEDQNRLAPLLNHLPWEHAARILATAEHVATIPGLYPVLLTSFKCSPDSFVLEYFKTLMAEHNKPYLILQLDGHDSSVGYETRIEAAIRAFTNHHAESSAREHQLPVVSATLPRLEPEVDDRTLIIPNWDRITCAFLVAALKREGIDALLMEESDQTIRESLRHNTGQCIPLNAVAQGFMTTIRNHDLDPSRCLLWLNRSSLACNIPLYPHHIKTILHEQGEGMEKAGVYSGTMSFMDISFRLIPAAYFAYLFGGMLRRLGCRVRPHEVQKGETDLTLDWAIGHLCTAFAGRISRETALKQVIDRFSQIQTKPQPVTKVAIFGDIYARDNRVMNQDLIRFIEAQGGEVITTPYSEYAKMIAKPYLRKWFNEGQYLEVLSNSAALATMKQMERFYLAQFNRILKEPEHSYDEPTEAILARFNVVPEHTGESMDNLLKVHYISRHHPDLGLFVQVSPALCCASLISEAMRQRIEQVTGAPVVSITYDGTGGNKNDNIIPYFRFLRGTDGGRETPWTATA